LLKISFIFPLLSFASAAAAAADAGLDEHSPTGRVEKIYYKMKLFRGFTSLADICVASVCISACVCDAMCANCMHKLQSNREFNLNFYRQINKSSRAAIIHASVKFMTFYFLCLASLTAGLFSEKLHHTALN
jgi:hypothetical protein